MTRAAALDPPSSLTDGLKVWWDGRRAPSDAASTMMLCQRILIQSDQAAVDKRADDWALFWREDDSYIEPVFPIQPGALAMMMPRALNDAALSFPINTAVGQDNIAPRAVTRLSEAAVMALTALLMAFEGIGAWCKVLNLVLIVLLPKGGGGGFRPIGLFPTIVRLWMGARVYVVRAWEAANAMPSIFGGKGMGAQGL